MRQSLYTIHDLLSAIDGFLSVIISPIILYVGIFVFVFVAVMVGLSVTGLHNYVAVFVALSIAATAFLTAAVKLHSEMRDRSFNMIAEYRKNKEIHGAMKRLSRVNRNRGTIDTEGFREIWRSGEAGDQEICNDIDMLADFFEEMSIAIFCNEANERLLERFYGGSFVRFFEFIQNALPVVRETPNGSEPGSRESNKYDVWLEMEKLYPRWERRYAARKSRRCQKQSSS